MPLAAGDATGVQEPQTPDARKDVTINVKVEGGNNGVLYSVGQPKQTDQNAEARVGDNPADVSGLTPVDHLRNGDEYQVTGSVVVASVDQLTAAGSDYPAWVTERYLGLPDNLPRRVRRKTREVVRGAGSTPYERAAAIETYLRTFPVDYDVPDDASGPRHGRLLPVRPAARLLRLPRLGDGGDVALARHTGARRDGLRR